MNSFVSTGRGAKVPMGPSASNPGPMFPCTTSPRKRLYERTLYPDPVCVDRHEARAPDHEDLLAPHGKVGAGAAGRRWCFQSRDPPRPP